MAFCQIYSFSEPAVLSDDTGVMIYGQNTDDFSVQHSSVLYDLSGVLQTIWPDM